MSQPDDPADPYQPPRPQPNGPQPPEYPQGYPEPSYTSGGYQGSYQGGAPGGYPDQGAQVPRGPEAVEQLLAGKPPAVRTLLQVMVAGGILEVLTGLLSLLSIDQVVADTVAELDDMAAETGMEPIQISAGLMSSVAAGTVVVSAALAAGLWLLFAWLFSRGQARVLGTVLGALNGVGSLFGLLATSSPVELALNLAYLGLVVAGLVLLWRRETTAWFRALTQARARVPWS